MRLFGSLYDLALRWAAHPKAPWYLAGLSFTESSFFPIPPDVMLMPMSLAKPNQAMYFAWIATLFSTLGGVLGYLIGMWLLDGVMPLIHSAGYLTKYEQIVAFFEHYGVWVVFVAGFSPLPYKMFTIAAGATGMALLPFVIASLVGRGARFFLVAWLMRWGGVRYEAHIRRWVEWIGWGVVALLVVYLVVR